MPEMTNAEMDAAVAVEVMGRRVALLGDNMYYFSIDGVEITLWRSDWRPTTDINQAFEVEKAMRKDGFAFFLESADDDHDYIVQFARYETDSWYTAVEKSAARAICAAALAAKRGENG